MTPELTDLLSKTLAKELPKVRKAARPKGAMKVGETAHYIGMAYDFFLKLRRGELPGLPPFPEPRRNGAHDEIYLKTEVDQWLADLPVNPLFSHLTAGRS